MRFSEWIEGRDLTMLDGGLATELIRAGFDINHELWSARVMAESPGAIVNVAHAFAEAGADILVTATYQATFPGLAKFGLNRYAAQTFFHQSVESLRYVVNASPTPKYLAASIGPYGAYLADRSEYTGNYGLSEEALSDFHIDRMRALADTSADLFAFETFPSASEVRVIAELLPRFPRMEAWVSFSCRDGGHLGDGTTLEEAVKPLLDHPQIVAIGANCIAPDLAIEIIERLAEAAPDKPVIIYPNAGQGWDSTSKAWVGEDTPEQFAERAETWHQAGARIVGGCCQTQPAHIRATRERLTNLHAN